MEFVFQMTTAEVDVDFDVEELFAWEEDTITVRIE